MALRPLVGMGRACGRWGFGFGFFGLPHGVRRFRGIVGHCDIGGLFVIAVGTLDGVVRGTARLDLRRNHGHGRARIGVGGVGRSGIKEG